MYSTAFWYLSFYWCFWLYCVTTVTPFIERRSNSGYVIKPKKSVKRQTEVTLKLNAVRADLLNCEKACILQQSARIHYTFVFYF